MNESGRVELAVLVSLEVRVGDQRVNLGVPTPRTLIAMLVMHLNQVVRIDALAAGLSGDRLPLSGTSGLHSHVSRLRRLVAAPAGGFPIERRSGGYALCGKADQVDARRFEQLHDEARTPTSRLERLTTPGRCCGRDWPCGAVPR